MSASIIQLHPPTSDTRADRIRTNQVAADIHTVVLEFLRHALAVHGDEEFERRARMLCCHISGIVAGHCGAQATADMLTIVYQAIPWCTCGAADACNGQCKPE